MRRKDSLVQPRPQTAWPMQGPASPWRDAANTYRRPRVPRGGLAGGRPDGGVDAPGWSGPGDTDPVARRVGGTPALQPEPLHMTLWYPGRAWCCAVAIRAVLVFAPRSAISSTSCGTGLDRSPG